jgi:hypothetical protein
VAELQQQVRETLERAFFDALAVGLRAGQAGRLAALLLDAKDQLAALLPPPPQQAAQQQQQGGSSGSISGSGGGGSSEGQALLAELQEKLDSSYVLQRLERYDAAYCAQAFDLLVHVITRLQAPARRQHTQEQYAQVAALFAAAAAAEANAAEEDSSAVLQSLAAVAAAGVSVVSLSAPQVQLRLTYGSWDDVAVQLAPAIPDADADAAGTVAVATPDGASEDSLPDLQWRLSLAPDGTSDGVIAVLAHSAAEAAPGEAAGGAAPGAGSSTSSAGGSNMGGSISAGSKGAAVSDVSIAAVVAAARLMHSQLNELKADVAAARLSMLRGEPVQPGLPACSTTSLRVWCPANACQLDLRACSLFS